MGAAVLDNLVAPVTTGVYSASPYDLDVAVAAPGLSRAITRTGSLSGGVADLRASAKPGSAVGGLIGGMARLIDVLSSDATARGARIRTGVRVVALRDAERVSAESDAAGALATSVDEVFDDAQHGRTDRDRGAAGARGERADGHPKAERPGRWRVILDDGEAIEADAVLLAAPAEAALPLLAQASESLSTVQDLGWPEPSEVDIVTIVVDDERLDAAPRGTGMLVAETVPQTEAAAKALTHVTAKWEWVARQLPAGRHVLRLSYGRAGAPSPLAGASDAEIRLRAIADASTLLNIPIAESSVVGSDVVRWTNAPPVAAQGQRERIERVRDGVEKVEGLEVTGSWLAGTGLASVVPDAGKAAERIRALRWNTLTDKE
jgi:oxygen-dependent protoporphyrinogen oxidase